MRLLLLIVTFGVCISAFHYESVNDKIEEIDKYTSQIDENLENYKWLHRKCCDCFGTDTFYEDNSTIVKIHNYQSCFNVDYYYKDDRLVLVTIDGSFERDCGWTEANYCWEDNIIRDYRARIYYSKKNILKIEETGSMPCCEIRPCGNYEAPIDFDNKAEIFLKDYGKMKVKKKNRFEGIDEY